MNVKVTRIEKRLLRWMTLVAAALIAVLNLVFSFSAQSGTSDQMGGDFATDPSSRVVQLVIEELKADGLRLADRATLVKFAREIVREARIDRGILVGVIEATENDPLLSQGHQLVKPSAKAYEIARDLLGSRLPVIGQERRQLLDPLASEVQRILTVLSDLFPSGMAPIERMVLQELLGNSYTASVVEAHLKTFIRTASTHPVESGPFDIQERDTKIRSALRYWLTSEIIARGALISSASERTNQKQRIESRFIMLSDRLATGATVLGTASFGGFFALLWGQLPTDFYSPFAVSAGAAAIMLGAIAVSESIERQVLKLLGQRVRTIDPEVVAAEALGSFKARIVRHYSGQYVRNASRAHFWRASLEFLPQLLLHPKIAELPPFQKGASKSDLDTSEKVIDELVKGDPYLIEKRVSKLSQLLVTANRRISSQRKSSVNKCERGVFL